MSNELENIERFRNELERLADELAVEAGEPPAFTKAHVETDETTNLVDSALKNLASGRRRQILHALRRLQQGSYGICAECGRPIDKERLEVIPEAGFCVACQHSREAGAESRFKAAQSDEEYV